MSRLAIIPARGGSKRLPRKNVLPFRGRPMIAHTIRAAQDSALFDRIVVSTEDREIADVAASYGAEVSTRTLALASDTASVADVTLDLLDREEQAGRTYDSLCVLYATAPLRTAEDITRVLSLLDPPRVEFSMAATCFDLPVHQALRVDEGGLATPVFPELFELPSQRAPKFLVDNGSTYAGTVPAVRREQNLVGPRTALYEMPRVRSVDLDTPADLELLQFHSGATR